jgi:hypothetical protein
MSNHNALKSRFANSKLSAFFVRFFCVLFLQKKDRFSGLNLCRFAKRNRHAFDLDFQGDKRGSEAPSFQAGMGILLRSKMYVIPTACSICFLMLG